MKKKSGAAQRLVSLVLALGLIFTLAPASVFAGDEVPASSTVTATAGEEPVVDTPEPAVDGTEPAVDGTEPVVDGTEPAVDGTEPVADGTEPAEEPAAKQDALKSAPVVASAPAALGDGPSARGIDETFQITECDSRLQVYVGVMHNYGARYEFNQQTVGGKTTVNFNVLGNNLYYFVKVPEGLALDVRFTNEAGDNKTGTVEALSSAKDIPDELRAQAEEKGCNYVFRFSASPIHDLGDLTPIRINVIEESYQISVNDATLNSNDFSPSLPQRVEKGGKRTVTLNESMTEPMITLAVNGTPLNLPLNLEEDLPFTTELPDGTKVAVTYKGLVGGYKYELAFTNIQSDLVISDYKTRQVTDMATVPTELTGVTVYYKDYDDPDYTQAVLDQPIPLDFDFAWGGQVRATQFKIVVDENYEAPVSLTLTKKNGEVINKTLDYDSEEKCYTFTLTRGIWNSDADIEIAAGDDSYVVNMAVSATPKTVFDAKFYIHEKGKPEVSDYTFVGTGSVSFGAPAWKYANNPIKLDSTNLDKVTEPSPLTFPDIKVDGVKYTYSKGSTTPGTYDFKGWDVAKAAWTDDTETKLEWHVDGIIVLHKALPDTMKPKVADFEDVYDGTAKTLSITYPDGKTEDNYTIEYQDANGNWVVGNPTLTNVDKLENLTIRFTMDGYAPYVAPDTYTLEVTKRPLTLRVNDDKIEDGERIPAFSYTITSGSLVSGQSITGVTYGGYKDELGIYDVNILTYKIVAGATDVTGNYDVTLLPGVFTIGTAGGGGGTTPTPNPNPNPTPVPVPVEPETPVTPVAPVTPDEEEEEPAEVEDIEEEETPQASPDTDADKEEDKTENIEDEETAQAGAPGEGSWALLNLILMVLTVVAGLVMLALRFARKTGMAHLLGIVPAIVALVAFFVTEDMSLPMAMTDKWTLIMALIAVVQVVLLVLGRNGAQEDDQPREQY